MTLPLIPQEIFIGLIMIGLFLFALLFAVVGYDWLGFDAVEREIKALDIPDYHKAAAILCMQQAQDADRRTRLYDLSAPIVMLFVLPFVSRNATKLPKLFSAWDNNVSLNGDSGGVLWPEGRWTQWRDMTDDQWRLASEIGLLSVSYDHPQYRGDAYYAPGHHPRSFWARYVWLGLRNRASKLALESGRSVDGPIEVLSGSIDIGTRKAGHFLLKCGDTYHYKSAKHFKLLGFDLVRVRSFGYKLEIAARRTLAHGKRSASRLWPSDGVRKDGRVEYENRRRATRLGSRIKGNLRERWICSSGVAHVKSVGGAGGYRGRIGWPAGQLVLQTQSRQAPCGRARSQAAGATATHRLDAIHQDASATL